ncbi:MAG: SIS domain-containing protein [Roseateles sp.]|uniref:SIS domain-containing protein n=1 Tax=Roseateles sp. TaxID=1971397 RepID=UPI00403654D9
MTLLHLDPTDLDHRGAAHTAREIAHQPAVWQTVYAQLQAERPALDAFLGPLLALPQLRIVLTGAGSSAFIGQCIAPALLRQLGARAGIRIEAVATTDIVSSPEQCLQPEVPTLLVSFARSGNSPESLAAVELADRFVKTCHHLVITCAADGTLNRRMAGQANARVLLLPDETNDRAFAMTSSFSGMLLAAAWALGLPLAPVTALAEAATVLAASEADRLYALTDQAFERIVYLGSNTLLGLAREAALKLLELTDGKLVAMADSTLGFRHGPKTILNDSTLVVIILSNDPYTRQYDLDLLHELRREGRARVLAIGTMPLNGTQAPHADDVRLALPAGAPDLALAPVALVFAQCLALLASLRLGITPDNPSASGTVTRVVSGVTIHPVIEQHPQP